MIEVRARGTTFVGEKRYPKGSPSPDPATTLTTDELVAKFCHNAEGVIPRRNIDGIVNAVLHLETIADVGTVMNLAAKSGKDHGQVHHSTGEIQA
jgi:hypothetical protein